MIYAGFEASPLLFMCRRLFFILTFTSHYKNVFLCVRVASNHSLGGEGSRVAQPHGTICGKQLDQCYELRHSEVRGHRIL